MCNRFLEPLHMESNIISNIQQEEKNPRKRTTYSTSSCASYTYKPTNKIQKKMLYRTTKYFRFIHSHLRIDQSLIDFPKYIYIKSHLDHFNSNISIVIIWSFEGVSKYDSRILLNLRYN